MYQGRAEHLRDVWVATRAALRDILEHVTLANIVSGDMPAQVLAQLETPGAWKRR